MNKILLHVEGLVVFALCLYFYGYYEFSWLLFIVLLFVPDIAMVGYFINYKIGAIIYNLIHTYSLSLIIVFIGFILSMPIMLAIGIIWTAHIGMDRMFGFGLKYPTSFKDTHFDRV